MGDVHVEILEELGAAERSKLELIRGWNAPPLQNTSDPITMKQSGEFPMR